jgi:DNA-binding MarR family transcriptional regulator
MWSEIAVPGVPKAVSALDRHLGYWLRYVSNQVSHAFGMKIEEHGVTVAEWVVLRALYDGQAMPSTLAERLGRTRGAISKLADRLVVKGLLARKTGSEDRRAQILALTAEGDALVPTLAALADKNDEEFFGHLAPATQETIGVAMREIVRRRRLKAVPMS